MQFVAGEMHLTIFMDEPIPHYAQDFQYLQLLPSTANDHGGNLVTKVLRKEVGSKYKFRFFVDMLF